MKNIVLLAMSMLLVSSMSGQAVITAVFDGPLGGGTPKGVEIYFTENVADLSMMGIASVNNGGGSDGTPEYVFPAGSATAGQYAYFASETDNFNAFFGFMPDYVDGAANINGDDAMELYFNGVIIDVFGDVNMDGTGTTWEYLNGWAARVPNTGPDGTTFNESNWTFSGIDGLTGATSNATADNPVPLKSYSGGMETPDHIITARNFEYLPDILVVDVGDLVQWDNVEGTHNVNGSAATFPNNSEDFFSGAPAIAPWSYQHRFNNPGANEYHCDLHFNVGMTGMVLVREEGDHHVSVENNFFAPSDITIELGETVVWTNVSGFHNVNGTLADYPNNPEGFGNGPASLNWTFAHTFNTPGTYDYHCDPHLGLGMRGTVTVVSSYPARDMATIKQVDGSGEAIYQDSLAAVSGIVYGPNFRSGNGVEFFLINGNNEGVYVRTTSNNTGYVVDEGDELIVSGRINQFNGLIQLVPEVISVESKDNTLLDPRVVNAPDESTEGSFIRINNVTVIDTSQWPDPGQSRNVDLLSGVDTVTMRIDADIMFSRSAPLGTFDVIGLGGQFDGSSPYDSGYQIFPRWDDDIIDDVSTLDIEDVGLNPLYPNPTFDFVHLNGNILIEEFQVFDLNGKLHLHQKVNSKNVLIDISDFATGVYFISARTDQGIGTSRVYKK